MKVLLLLLMFQTLAAQSLNLGLNLDLPDLNRIQAALISQAENKFQNHVLTNLTEIITKKIPSNMPKISETCLKDWNFYIDKLNVSTGISGWALKMFDASGKLPPSGLLEGSFTRLPGNLESCLEVEAPTFMGQWCNFYVFNLPSKLSLKPEMPEYGNIFRFAERGAKRGASGDLINGLVNDVGSIQVGQCLPDSCTIHEVEEILSSLTLAGAGLYSFPSICKRNDDVISLTTNDYVVIGIITGFVLLIIIGTITDLVLRHFEMSDGLQSTKFVVVFQGFSLYIMFRKIFHVGENKDNLGCINGIRFLSMAWVVIGHTYLLISATPPPMANPSTIMQEFVTSYGMRTILNATPSVDSFFLIGALLLSYLTLQQLDIQKGGSVKFWAMFYVHRYIRLTGVYAMAVAINATLVRYLDTKNGYIFPALADQCADSWWTNLFYINNFQEFLNTEDCMGHTWYMANDMQMFVFSPILIYAMHKLPIVGVSATGVIAIASTSYRIWWYADSEKEIGDFNDMYGFEGEGEGKGGALPGDFEYVYSKPWTRIAPYAIGLIAGFILHKTKKMKIDCSTRNIVIAGFVNFVSVLTLYLVVYGKDPANTTELGNKLYQALFRTGWGLGLGMLILSCAKGFGGFINSFLSWGLWAPLAKMSYSCYLMHFNVLWWFVYQPTYRMYISQPLWIYYCIANVCISMAVGFVMVILFEAPIMHLEKLLFGFLGLSKLPTVNKYKVQ